MEIFAAIDTETSGLNRQNCELLSIAIIPLNNDFTLSEIPEFVARIKAEHPETAETKALEVNGLDPKDGKPRTEVLQNLVAWMTENGIDRIIPVAHNLSFDMDFIGKAFPELRKVFSTYGRDSMRLALTVNDIWLRDTGEVFFPKVSLQAVKERLNIFDDVLHNAYEDAKDVVIVYRRLLTMLAQA